MRGGPAARAGRGAGGAAAAAPGTGGGLGPAGRCGRSRPALPGPALLCCRGSAGRAAPPGDREQPPVGSVPRVEAGLSRLRPSALGGGGVAAPRRGGWSGLGSSEIPG